VHVPIQEDLCLATEICVAEKDGRECPWYGAYSRVLRDYIFRSGGDGQRIYTIIPQYSLVATLDSGHSIETDLMTAGITTQVQAVTPQNPSHQPSVPPISPVAGVELPSTPKRVSVTDIPRTPGYHGRKYIPSSDSPLTSLSSGESASFSGPRYLPGLTSPTPAGRKHTDAPEDVRRSERIAKNLPVSYNQPTPSTTGPVTPQRTQDSIWKSTRIPDFVVSLYKIPTITTFPMVFNNEIYITGRTVLIVEIKPDYNMIDWERLWFSQVRAQAQHAFAADEKLLYLGIIMARGRRWVYAVCPRLPLETQTASERRDKTYVPSPNPSLELKPNETSGELFMQPTETSRELYTTPLDKCNPHTQYTTGRWYFDESYLLDPDGKSQKYFNEVLQDLRQRNEDM